MLNAKNAILTLPGGQMEYIRFGCGKKTLIMLPGLGDGLRTMKGTAIPLALFYRQFTKDYTVYIFSRKTALPEGYGIRDMARDQAVAMEMLGIHKADIIGVSMGGMIAQWLAADYPEKIGKLALVVTAAEPNPLLTESVELWMAQAKAGDHTALMDSNLQRIYSERYYRQNKWLVPFLGKLTKPKSYDRFLVQAQACLAHNAAAVLPSITAPTLVMGGEKDLALGGEPSRQIAAAIPNAELRMYPQWGHGLYEEEKTFNKTLLQFFRK